MIKHKTGVCAKCLNGMEVPLIARLCLYHYRRQMQEKSLSRQAEKPKKPVRIKPKKKAEVTVFNLIKKAETVFNAWIRERDLVPGNCISCNEFTLNGHAGHYLPAGSNASVRFHEHNVNLQCVNCNINLNGNQENYRKGLIKKIGQREVEALELLAKQPFKWDREALLEIIEKYKSFRRLSKAS